MEGSGSWRCTVDTTSASSGSSAALTRTHRTSQGRSPSDATGAEALEELLDELDERQVELAFAELKGTVRDRLVPYGLVERIGPHRFDPTIGLAVKDYVAETGVPWVDWEDEAEPTP